MRAHLDSCQSGQAYSELVETIERLLLAEALRRCQGNQTQAAKLLGLQRPTLHAKLQKFGLQARGE